MSPPPLPPSSGPPRDRLGERLARERDHARLILASGERNWGWHTPAGRIRWQRRLDFLCGPRGGAPARVLEVGAGTGTFTAGLCRAYPGLVSIDVSAELLALARDRAPGARLAQMDAHRLAFPDACFDLVLGCSVLHHLDWQRALEEAFRVLRPGGRLLFSEPNLLNPQIFLQKNLALLKRLAGDSPDEYAFTARQARACLRRAGFDEVAVRGFEFLHPGTPSRLIPALVRLESLLSRTPLRALAGSLLIEARRPGGGARPAREGGQEDATRT